MKEKIMQEKLINLTSAIEINPKDAITYYYRGLNSINYYIGNVF